ncbi:MAG TPA: transketolase [Acidobacteria bacterium]|nr:transketolase [Acidobacteriota bacterium]
MKYEDVLRSEALRREEVIVLTAENRAPIRHLPPSLGLRFIDVGICEQTMIGAAAGLALRGRVPVAHALASFLTMRAFEFIRTDLGIARLPVKLVGYVPGFLSEANGPTHQAIEDVALMRGIPSMRVVCPADEDELAEALPALLDDPCPCYIRYNHLAPAVAHRAPFVLGRAEVLSEGDRVALLTYGFLLREAAAAARLLEQQGVPVRLVNLRTLAPADEAEIVASARGTGLLVTIEDHFATGGLYSLVAEVLLRHGVRARVHPIHLGDRWFTPALLPDVLETERFSGIHLAARVLAALEAP